MYAYEYMHTHPHPHTQAHAYAHLHEDMHTHSRTHVTQVLLFFHSKFKVCFHLSNYMVNRPSWMILIRLLLDLHVMKCMWIEIMFFWRFLTHSSSGSKMNDFSMYDARDLLIDGLEDSTSCKFFIHVTFMMCTSGWTRWILTKTCITFSDGAILML